MSTAEVQRVQCTGCKAGFKLKSAGIGKNVKCPKCQTVFKAVPVPRTAPSAQQSPAQSRTAAPISAAPVQAEVVNAAIARPEGPPGTKRCDWCHEFVPLAEFDEHYSAHQGKRDDGQYNTYPSLPPEEQWKGDLKTVPQNYVHPECGAVTRMPEEIIRTYIANPYFYGYSSFCCGCGTHISGKQLKWVDTGESLYDYTKRLQASNPNSKKYRSKLIQTLVATSVVGGIVLGLIAAAIAYFVTSPLVAAAGFVAGGLLGTMACFGLLLKMRGRNLKKQTQAPENE